MATLDLMTLADAKEILRRGQFNVVDDTQITRAVTAFSELIDNRYGPVVVRARTEYLDGGDYWVRCTTTPIVSFTTVKERIANGTPTTLTAEDYTSTGGYLPEQDDTGAYTGKVWRRTGRAFKRWYPGAMNVEIVTSAGRFANTAAVTERWVEACGLCLQAWFRRRDESVGAVGEFMVPAANFPTFAIPRAVDEMLGAELRPVL